LWSPTKSFTGALSFLKGICFSHFQVMFYVIRISPFSHMFALLVVNHSFAAALDHFCSSLACSILLLALPHCFANVCISAAMFLRFA